MPPLKHGSEWANVFLNNEQRRRQCVMDFDAAEGIGTDAALAAWMRTYGAAIRARLNPDQDF
jgi:hypothetical protein